MSSGLLYLAIIGVWAVVLVPMWVRGNDSAEARAESAEGPGAPRSYGRARARVVARRRRRLSGIVLLFAVTCVIAAVGVAPWWIVPVPGALLLGYLGCLRAAAVYDTELREREEARAARDAYASAGAYEPEQPEASESGDEDVAAGADTADDSRVIDFASASVWAQERLAARDNEEPFDQYAEPAEEEDGEPHRRAVGD